MIVKAIKTRKFLPPHDNLWELLSNIKSLKENSVVVVSSKVVSIGEGRCVSVRETTKDELAIEEADKYLDREESPSGFILQTIKNNLLVASAGVDESNGKEYFILWPKDPKKAAKRIWQFLKKKFGIKNLGVVISDSRLVPLRRGVVGISIGFFGFKPLRDYRGKKDIFGRVMRMETSNLPDSLATAAVLEMGEGSECKPIAIISEIHSIEFIQHDFRPKSKAYEFSIPYEEDMFYPFLSKVLWKKGGSGKKGI